MLSFFIEIVDFFLFCNILFRMITAIATLILGTPGGGDWCQRVFFKEGEVAKLKRKIIEPNLSNLKAESLHLMPEYSIGFSFGVQFSLPFFARKLKDF